jgi:hypothetical protein
VRYQSFRSVSDVHVFVLCYGGTFYEIVPDDVRRQGPWQCQCRGGVDCLKPKYRLALDCFLAKIGFAHRVVVALEIDRPA